MCVTYTIQEGIDLIKDCFNKLPKEVLYSPNDYLFKYAELISDNITLLYPGKKTNPINHQIDYKFEYKGTPLSHEKICCSIYRYQVSSILSYNNCLELLEEAYSVGLCFYPGDESRINELRRIMFWASLQEELNYPLAYNENGSIRRYGRLLPFCRYAEALAITNPDNKAHTINEVIDRTNNHGKSVPQLWNLQHVPQYYTDTLKRNALQN